LREDEHKKESDFAKKLQEKEQEIKNAKKDILTTKRNCLEKESEIKELGKELNSMKGNLCIGSAGFKYNIRYSCSHYERNPRHPLPHPDLTLSSWKRLQYIPARGLFTLITD